MKLQSISPLLIAMGALLDRLRTAIRRQDQVSTLWIFAPKALSLPSTFS
jgi:hypothetical protein